MWLDFLSFFSFLNEKGKQASDNVFQGWTSASLKQIYAQQHSSFFSLYFFRIFVFEPASERETGFFDAARQRTCSPDPPFFARTKRQKKKSRILQRQQKKSFLVWKLFFSSLEMFFCSCAKNFFFQRELDKKKSQFFCREKKNNRNDECRPKIKKATMWSRTQREKERGEGERSVGKNKEGTALCFKKALPTASQEKKVRGFTHK